MHDEQKCLNAFLKAAVTEKIDFATQLGDFSCSEDTSYCVCDS